MSGMVRMQRGEGVCRQASRLLCDCKQRGPSLGARRWSEGARLVFLTTLASLSFSALPRGARVMSVNKRSFRMLPAERDLPYVLAAMKASLSFCVLKAGRALRTDAQGRLLPREAPGPDRPRGTEGEKSGATRKTLV